MYYLYGVSGPSLLIESTNSMIMNIVIDKAIKRIIRNFCAAPVAVVFSQHYFTMMFIFFAV